MFTANKVVRLLCRCVIFGKLSENVNFFFKNHEAYFSKKFGKQIAIERQFDEIDFTANSLTKIKFLKGS